MDELLVLILTAREYYDRDEELPVDTYMELTMAGIDPDELYYDFEDGSTTDEIYNYYNEGDDY